MTHLHDQPTPTPEQVRAYGSLLINRRDVFLGLALAGHWVCRRQPLTGSYLRAALRAEVGLGLYSVDERGCSRWACLDVDDNVQGARLHRVIAQLEEPHQ